MNRVLISLIILFAGTLSFADSSFNEVRRVIMDQDALNIQNDDVAAEMAMYQRGQLPQYEVNMHSIFQFGSSALENAAKRTIKNHADYLERLPKLLHPNGVCVMGKWQMNSNSPFTGAFAPGEKLFIGRISVAMENTTNKSSRGFGFAGKIFPTQNAEATVGTENFFSVDVLMGTKTPRFLDTATTNEPEIGFDIWLIKLALKITSALKTADENPGFRPVKNLAMLDLAKGEKVKFPKWIRISAAKNTIKNNLADFRSEILQAVKDNNELVFMVDGSDTTKDRSAATGWTNLGKISISESAISYGCDRRLHFAHPTLN